MSTFVHVLQNPLKLIKIDGNFNDKSTWRKQFPKQNGNIFNGFWLIGLKSFAYEIKEKSQNTVLNVHCNVVIGFEQNLCQPANHCNPSISQICLNTDTKGAQIKDFNCPSFFPINNVNDVLELDFSFFPKQEIPHIYPEAADIKFQAIFHYYCQTS